MSDTDPYEREAAKAAIKVLQRELAEAKNKIERQVTRIKYLEGATNHATGTPLAKALKQLDEMKIDRDEWKAVSEGRLLGSIDKVAQLERELAKARECAEILRDQLQIVGEMYAGGKVPPLPELPWSQPDLSREALIAAVKGRNYE